MHTWSDKETVHCPLKDNRLDKRFKLIIDQLSNGIGKTIPFACQDWANTKAAYRFFSNKNFDEKDILKGHFQSTRERFIESNSKVLVLQDTTQFTYKRKNINSIGATHRIGTAKTADGRFKKRMVRGILMHSSLAVTTECLPLGLAAVKFWTRKKFKGCNALKKKFNPTRISITKKGSIIYYIYIFLKLKLYKSTKRTIYIISFLNNGFFIRC